MIIATPEYINKLKDFMSNLTDEQISMIEANHKIQQWVDDAAQFLEEWEQYNKEDK